MEILLKNLNFLKENFMKNFDFFNFDGKVYENFLNALKGNLMKIF